VRLVVLRPSDAHVTRAEQSDALRVASEVLAHRGSIDRLRKNMLVFLAPDSRRLVDLEQAVAEHLSWQSIVREADAGELNLDGHQAIQGKTKLRDAHAAVDLRIAETYQWLLVPDQPDAMGPIDWQTTRVDGPGTLAERASRRLVTDGALQTELAPLMLRLKLDGDIAARWADGWVAAGVLWEDFARYVYLPRLVGQPVLLEAVRRGPASILWQSEGFATADAVDADGGLLGLVTGSFPGSVGPSTLVVRPDVALAQIDEEIPDDDDDERSDRQAAGNTGSGVDGRAGGTGPRVGPPHRFHASAVLGSERPGRDFDRIVQEVLTHLTGVVSADVEVVVEITATAAEGFPDAVVRTVSENAKTLRLRHGFEED
jgi:hypothetical protein